MAIIFPPTPTIGEIYTDPTTEFRWLWDGTKWNSTASVEAFPTGDYGSLSPNAAFGIGIIPTFDCWIQPEETLAFFDCDPLP